MSGHKIFEKVSSLPTAKVHLSVDELHLFIVYTCIHTFHSTSKEQQQQIKSFAIIMQTRTTALAPWMYADTLWVYRHSITSIPAIATATTTKPFPSQLNFQTKTPALTRSFSSSSLFWGNGRQKAPPSRKPNKNSKHRGWCRRRCKSVRICNITVRVHCAHVPCSSQEYVVFCQCKQFSLIFPLFLCVRITHILYTRHSRG